MQERKDDPFRSVCSRSEVSGKRGFSPAQSSPCPVRVVANLVLVPGFLLTLVDRVEDSWEATCMFPIIFVYGKLSKKFNIAGDKNKL